MADQVKILIIEDDPFVRRFYERLFSKGEYIVEMSESGENGIQKAKTFQPELILLDIMMPVTNGLQVLGQLKSGPETKDIPVVMLTNVGDDETMQTAKNLGADGYIIKSDVAPEKLLTEVDKYLQQGNNTLH